MAVDFHFQDGRHFRCGGTRLPRPFVLAAAAISVKAYMSLSLRKAYSLVWSLALWYLSLYPTIRR